MTDGQWGAVWQVYDDACALPEPQRDSYVHSQLSGDEAAKVISMLRELAEPNAHVTDESRAAPDAQLEPGDSIGRFTVIRLLGRGGMGEVYSAQDPELGRTVALKLLRTGGAGTMGALEQFILEARAASALNHPGIVTVYEVVRNEPSLAIVMELIEGTPLRELVGLPNTPGKIASYGLQIAQALKAAHSRGIVHRDIKPENVMLREDGLLKVLDFGLARHVSEKSIEEVPLGTLGYMSPEQVRGGILTPASDIFSLGVILFELATGAHPFLRASASETTRAIAMLDPGSMDLAGEVRIKHRGLEWLVRTMLSKNPQQRPDAAAVAAQLDTIVRAFDRRRPAWQLVAAGVGTVFLLGSIGWWVMNGRAKPQVRNARVTQVSSLDGSEIQPSLSPDGRRMVFAWSAPDQANQNIYTQQVGEDSPVRLTNVAADDSHPVWSPNGSWIAFLRRATGESQALMVLIAPGGGPERSIARIVDPGGYSQPLAWWPDSKSLIVRDDSNGGIGLVRLNIQNGQKTTLTSPHGSTNDTQPVASPTSNMVAFVRQVFGAKRAEICLLRLGDTSGERCVLETPEIDGLVWREDGRALAYAVTGGIWQVPINGFQAATPFQLTAGNFHSLAGDAKGVRLVAERRFSDANIWRASADGKRNSKIISSSSYETDPDASPDGQKVVCRSERTGNYELWATGPDGAHPTRLTHFGGDLGSARWSPDGTTIAFDGFRPSFDKNIKKPNIYVVPAAGGPIRRITDDRYTYLVPNWSRDGRWLYCIREDGSLRETWKFPSQGGDGVQVSKTGMFDIVESEDGQYLYYTRPNAANGIWRRPAGGGAETLVAGTEKIQQYRYWHLGHKGIYFAEGPANPAIQLLDLVRGTLQRLPVTLDGFHKGGRGLAVSPDGTSFYYTRNDVQQSDLFAIDID